MSRRWTEAEVKAVQAVHLKAKNKYGAKKTTVDGIVFDSREPKCQAR